MNRRLCIMIVTIFLFMTGCSKKEDSTTEVTTELYAQENTLLQEYSLFNSVPVVFDSDYAMPIIKDGIEFGWLQINFVEMLGIWDISNYQANQNGVTFSYAINCKINLENYVNANEMINVILIPELLGYDNTVIGTAGYVGWSGYPESAELYQNSFENNFEVILQPIVPERDSWYTLAFHIADVTNKIQFDTLYVDLKCLDSATLGAQIQTINDVSRITSINGASYTISFHDVYLEQHRVRQDASYKDGLYRFYDFQYDLSYDTAPNNERSVMAYDRFNNNALISTPVIEVYSDLDATKLYEPNHNAQRVMYSDRSTTENYTWEFPDYLMVGETCTVSTNRMIPGNSGVKPSYLRVVLKFPSEAKARDFNEMQDFNGRYLVYQLPLGTRILEEAPR